MIQKNNKEYNEYIKSKKLL